MGHSLLPRKKCAGTNLIKFLRNLPSMTMTLRLWRRSLRCWTNLSKRGEWGRQRACWRRWERA